MPNTPQNIVVLGSTGSIGRSTLSVVENLGSNTVRVVGLAAGRSWEQLGEQAIATGCENLVLTNPEAAVKLRDSGISATVASGDEALLDMVLHNEVDTVVCAITGARALPPVLAAIRAGKRVALASKEVLVMAGGPVMQAVSEHNAELYPIDSEHSAILQCLQGVRRNEVSRFILTASGGPFRGMNRKQLESVTVEQALAHPTWDMGPKITIDSATLMNKGLELIEACWLFDATTDQVDVVIHPQSVIHSMIELCDGGFLAQLGPPDMRLPIQFALTHPEHRPLPMKRLNLRACGDLSFHAPDDDAFPALRLARHAATVCGTLPAVLNAANEQAVAQFLDGKISFLDIADRVEKTMDAHDVIQSPTLDDILAADAWARQKLSGTGAGSPPP